MSNKVLCTLPPEDIRNLQDLTWMKSALEDLAIVIAEQNHILREDSELYLRLINDYKEYLIKINDFWSIYLKKYHISDNEQLMVDYKTQELIIVPKSISCCEKSVNN